MLRGRRAMTVASGRRDVGWGVVALALLLLLPLAVQVSAQSRDAQEEIFSQEEICRRKFQEGIQYKNNQQIRQAADRFAEVKETCPEMIEAYLNLGEALVRLKQYQEAIDTYQDALDQDPGNLDVKEYLAFALSSAGELDEALGLYLELHEARPEKPELLRNLAFVYQQKGMIAEAVMIYVKLVEMDEADPRTVSEAGRLALNSNLFLPAVTFYTKLYEFNPTDKSTLHILAGYYFQIKFYERAVFYYDKLLELTLTDDEAIHYHQVRGYCRNKIKDFPGAAEDYRYLTEKQPEDVSHWCNLAFAYRDGGQTAQALQTVERGRQLHPDAGCLEYAWGVTLAGEGERLEKQGSFEEAIDHYQRAKSHFARVVELRDALYGQAAAGQLERMDQLIERVGKLIERRESGR